MSDTDRWQEWTPSVTSIRRLDHGRRSWQPDGDRQPKFPPALWRLTAIEPGKSFTWISAAPGVRVIAHHSVTETAGGSRVTLSLEYQGFFGGLLRGSRQASTERYLAFEAHGLKARSEIPSSASTSSADPENPTSGMRI